MGFVRSVGRAAACSGVVALMQLAGVDTASAELPAGGTIYLELGSVDRVRWVKPDATLVIQSISDLRDITGSSKDACKLALGSPTILTMTSQGKTVGFNSQKDWIGIREQSRGVDCGRLVQGQSIVLALGPDLSQFVVQSSRLEINAKKNAVVRAVASADGATQTFTLKTGLAATGTPGPNEQFCNPGVSDSSPDSRATCAWTFTGPWKQLTFFTDAGEWSLAAGDLPSEFQLVEFSGLLGCPSVGNEVIGEIQGPNGLASSGFRLENVLDPLLDEPVPACVVVPYVYSATCPAGLNLPPDPVCTNFVYDFLDQGTHMAFYFEWSWPPEPVPGQIDQIPETLQFFINGNTTGVQLDLCPEIVPLFDDPNGTPDDPTDDVFVGIDPAFPAADQEPTVPGTQAGCLITRNVIQDGSEVLVIEGAYIQGDYVASRSGLR